MDLGKWALSALLALTVPGSARAQGVTVNERLIELSEVLGNGSTYPSATRIHAIREIGAMRTVSALAAGLLFDRANVRYEPDPLVREASAQTIRFTVDLRNRMGALRLGRITTPAVEPDPRVRIAALRSLAAFETAEAAASIYDAATEEKEPEPAVREAARELIGKGLAASRY